MNAPRIFHTGDVIYGGGAPGIHQDIADDAEARSALIRIKAEGGPSSFSYKNYQLPSRFVPPRRPISPTDQAELERLANASCLLLATFP